MLGAGVALLLSEMLSGDDRRAIGWTLFAVGALTTVPLIMQMMDSAGRVSPTSFAAD